MHPFPEENLSFPVDYVLNLEIVVVVLVVVAIVIIAD